MRVVLERCGSILLLNVGCTIRVFWTVALDGQYYYTIFWFVEIIVSYVGDIGGCAIYCAFANTDVQLHGNIL